MSNMPLGLDRAQYAPALQHNYLKLIGQPASEVRGGLLPSGLVPADLNPLDPDSPLVHAPYVLISGGQYLGKGTTPPWLKNRPAGFSTVIGDSGGFQFITKPFHGVTSCRQSLDWMEDHANIGITLDIPTRAIGGPTGQFPTFTDALLTSVDNNRFFLTNRGGKTRYLTALQGRDRKEIKVWYDNVSPAPFEGWAFGGSTRDLPNFIEVICWLLRDGKLNTTQSHLHVLGTSTATVAVLLTVVQTTLRSRLNLPELQITFDTASPSHMMMYGKAAGPLRASPTGLGVSSVPLPCNGRYRGSTTLFPWSESAIGKLLTLGDLCVSASSSAANAWDELSAAMVVNHSIDRMLAGFEQACRLAELNPGSSALLGKGFRADFMPAKLLGGLMAVERILSAPDPLEQFRHSKGNLGAWAEPDEIEPDH